jgi:hypothetical protein
MLSIYVLLRRSGTVYWTGYYRRVRAGLLWKERKATTVTHEKEGGEKKHAVRADWRLHLNGGESNGYFDARRGQEKNQLNRMRIQ